MAAQILDVLRKENRHQKILDDVLRRLAGWLGNPGITGKDRHGD